MMTDAELMEISQLKRIVDGIYSTLEAFNGTVPILFLNYLAMFPDALDALGASEAAVVSTLTYYI